jgi:hypothetical protein
MRVDAGNVVLVFVETPQLSADSVVFLTSEGRPWLNGRYISVAWDLPELLEERRHCRGR